MDQFLSVAAFIGDDRGHFYRDLGRKRNSYHLKSAVRVYGIIIK